MGAQVKDLIVLVELFTYFFLFHFEIQQSVQVILIVSFVSSGVQKGVDNPRLQGMGYSYIFSTQFFEYYQRAQQNFLLACLTEDLNISCSPYVLKPCH